MLTRIFVALAALIISLGGGFYLSDITTQEVNGFGKLQIGNWTAYPDAASSKADPYLRASYARMGKIGLGSAEGLSFIAQLDNEDEVLNAACDYRISGQTPSARLWTLRLVDEQFKPIAQSDARMVATHSGALIRDSNGQFSINISSQATTGNWLPLSGSSPIQLALTLYDTSIASYAGVGSFIMPQIRRLGCRDE